MATRSLIGAIQPDKSIRYIYCHSDGYLSHNGHILRESYTDPTKITALLDLGDISSLGPEIGEKHNFDWMMSKEMVGPNGMIDWEKVNSDPRRKMCRAYGRDRGETGVSAKRADNRADFLAADMGQDYYYLWNGKAWLYATYRFDEKPSRWRRVPTNIAD